MAKVRVTLTRSVASRTERQKGTVRALGLRRIRQSVVHEQTPQIMGMVRAVSHLVDWEQIEE
ncbi:MAG: 50S ribosomal protein L30 [Thermovirgaceae bacterium]|jgi:large subunit ribosomal protein L30